MTEAGQDPLPRIVIAALMPAHRLRFELFFALGWIAFGALLLPALVYGVGIALLGKYVDGGLGAFYANLYRDLVTGATAPLALILGPYVALMLARVPLIGRKRAVRDAEEDTESTTQSATPRSRVEPRIGG